MTDKRPIDANALYEDVSRMGLTNGSTLGRHSGMADAIAQMIQDAPTIDPESLRGHAKWESRRTWPLSLWTGRTTATRSLPFGVATAVA